MFVMETNNSQEFADYFNECLVIRQGRSWEDTVDGADEDSYKPGPDSDFEAEWLRDLGFDALVNSIEAGKEVEDENLGALFMSLTHHQAAVVKKRITSLKTTVRKGRIPKHKVRDVREVFPQHNEALSAGTRSRSATPDSLDSISPSHSPPSPGEWLPSAVNGSPTPSQGYHSHSRSSPDILEAADVCKPRVVTSTGITADLSRRSSNPACLELVHPAGQHSEQEPNFTRIFRAPSVGEPFSSLPGADLPSANNQHFSQTRFRHTSSHDALLRHTKHVYNFSSTGTLGSDTGIEILDYQCKGSMYISKGRLGAMQVLGSGLSDSDISLELRDDLDPGYRLDLDWGFERSSASEDDSEFAQVTDRDGVTRLEDLGPDDVRKIKTLALIELTALFDVHNIQYARRKPVKKKRKDGTDNVFGVPLSVLLEFDRRIQPDCKVPLVMKKILSHLEKYGLDEEGILRVPGVVAKIQTLKQEIETHFYSSPGLVDQALKAASVNDAAALVKQFLRELPVPLLTNEYMDAFFQIDSITDKTDQIKVLKLLILLLPDVHRDTLEVLFDFLIRVINLECQNRMSLQNVAMIIAPNLFLPKKQKKNADRDLTVEINLAAATCKTTKMMIKYRDILWTVPSFLIQQIRLQNETAMYRKATKDNGKHVKNKKSKKAEIYRKINNEVDYQEGIIRVQAPQFGKSNVAVKLYESTTAQDVVYKCIQEFRRPSGKERSRQELWKRSSSESSMNSNLICMLALAEPAVALENHLLYEIGGNIGERCLSPKANMIAVYQRNPNAEWKIRCKHWTNQPVVKEVMLM